MTSKIKTVKIDTQTGTIVPVEDDKKPVLIKIENGKFKKVKTDPKRPQGGWKD